MAQPPVGIDLGTTYSVVATLDDDGKVKVLHNSVGIAITPSAVYFESPDNFVVGQAAKEARVDAQERVVEFIKRQMGTDFTFRVFDKTYSPIEISARILKQLKQDAEAVLGTQITDVVITCPAYFTAEERDATQKAGEVAGFNVLQLLNEPTAAALAFGMGGNKTGNALVFDLGGGTFDVTLLNFTPDNEIDVRISDGNKRLGGRDFDDAIMRLAVAFFQAETGYNLTEDLAAYAELRDKAERAKVQISAAQSVAINLSAGGHRAKFVLERPQFEEAIEGLLMQMQSTLEDVLEKAHLTADQIDEVILVGGSTYVPAVRNMVETFFGKTPNFSVNADEAVGQGAALYAAQLMTEGAATIKTDKYLPSVAVTNTLKNLPGIQDIVNHSLGIRAVRNETDQVGYNSIILKRGQKLPAEDEDTFNTISEGQDSIASALYEGEYEDINDVNEIGKWEYLFGREVPKGYPFKVKISLDKSSIIKVLITDIKTGEKKLIEFQYTSNMSQKQVENARKDLAKQKSSSM